MIAISTRADIILSIQNKEFVGGGGIHSYHVIRHIKEKEDVVLLPSIPDILFNKEKFCDKVDVSNLELPPIIQKFCNSSGKFSYSDILNEYVNTLNGTKIIFDPHYQTFLNFSSLKNKIILSLKAFSKANVCNELVSYDAYCLALKSDKKIVSTIQFDIFTPLDSLRYIYYSQKFKLGDPFFALKSRFNQIYISHLKDIVKSKNLKYLLSVSEGVAKSLGIKSNKIIPLKVGNAYDENLLQYRTKSKENYLIYYARLYKLKGLLEIPYILKEVKKNVENVQLILFGKFWNDEDKNKFFKLIKLFNLENNVKYLGFLPEEEKYKVISKAKALIYPTHTDSFSIVILESLALGTPVISYKLLGPYSVYKNLSAVKFVKEFDVKGMAREAIEILRMKDEDYFNLIYNEKTNKFLEAHKGWDKVAEEIYYYLTS